MAGRKQAKTRKTAARNKTSARTKRGAKRTPKPKPPATARWVSVSQAAEENGYTPQAIYAAIKKKTIVGEKVDGRWRVLRKSAIDYRRGMDEWLAAYERRKSGKMTDEEFLQAMIDNDPD